MIGQVGRLGHGSGAGGSKLERILSLPPTPGDPSLCPEEPNYLFRAWLFHTSLVLCGQIPLPGILLPPPRAS